MVDRYSRTGRIAYIHFRNVRGKVPYYHETFIDEGDTDMLRVLRILKSNGYDGHHADRTGVIRQQVRRRPRLFYHVHGRVC